MKTMYRMCWGFIVGFVGSFVLLYFAGVFISWEWDISTWWEVFRGFMLAFAAIIGFFCAALTEIYRD